jgi:hypothetical protein
MIDKALDLGTASRREFLVSDLSDRRQGPQSLIPATQDFTAGWVALGPEISVDGHTRVSLWFVLGAVNNSLLIDFRCVGRMTSGGVDHPLPIYNPNVAGLPGTYNILVEAEYVRLNNVAPINLVLTWDIANTMPFIAFQIRSDDVGQDVFARLTSAHVTYGWGS